MKNLLGQLFFRSRYPLAVGAGLMLAAAFPSLSIAGLAWVAPALLLASAFGKTGRDAWRIGYVGGLAHYLASLYWLLLIPVAGYPILAWLALSGYCAIYPAIWVWLLAGKVGEGSWSRRTAWSLAGAAIWVALEMVVSRLFSGFPWNLLGTSQYRILPLIQITSFVGVHGVSFLVIWVSLSLFSAARIVLSQPAKRMAWQSEILLPLAMLVAVFVFGFSKLREPVKDGPTLRVTLIQPSIPQTMIWKESESTNRFNQLVALTSQALTNETDLLLWPEAAVPKMIRYDETTFRAITGLASSNHVWMIMGSDDAEPPRNGSTNAADADYFNSSFLVGPEGKLVNVYHKRNLVIFGEYIPLVRWLPFIKWFTPITGGFTAGEKVVPFELERWGERPREPEGPKLSGSSGASPHQPIRTATLICFEDVFAQLVPEYVDDDTDFLINLTNDGWFGEGAEQWQHAAAGVFRAVENNVPLARCCNNGLTCWIDSRGRLQQVFHDQSGSVYGAGVMTAQIPVLAPGEKREPTFYNRHGDWFGWGCVMITTVVILDRLRHMFQRKP